MTLQMRHFAETVASGHDSPIAGVQRAYEVMQIVDAAYRSASSEARVKLT
jgi:predicted dehydrogenase